jgi:hypothetical protein
VVETAAKDGVDWWTMRIATSPHYSDTLEAVEERWSFARLVHAHKTLDALDDITAAQRPDPPKGGR